MSSDCTFHTGITLNGKAFTVSRGISFMSFKSCPEGPTELNGHMHVDQIQAVNSEQRVRDCLELGSNMN